MGLSRSPHSWYLQDCPGSGKRLHIILFNVIMKAENPEPHANLSQILI